MSVFFIARPVLAWVLAILVMLAGVVGIARLPVAMFPDIAPPAIEIDASYPGASAAAVENAVTQIIEQNMTGLDHLLYIASTSDGKGNVAVTLTFASGTDADLAQIQVQNKLQQAVPLLPQVVQQQGISVTKGGNGFTMVLAFVDDSGTMGPADIGDYISSSFADGFGRVPGVGNVQLLGSKYAMRIWLDADRLANYQLTPADIVSAIQAQNSQVSVGELGAIPSVSGQQLNATITGPGRLSTPAQFEEIVVGSSAKGAKLRLKDVARVELGQANYGTVVAYNGKSAAGLGIDVSPGANAIELSNGVRELLERIKPHLPPGLKAVVTYDTTTYVKQSIAEVVKTLAEAIVLVFVVMLLFLQNLRATLIPTIAVPVVLLGTFGVLAVAGYSINMLTMFAVVLAIGLLVDDAIIVVENVERLMAEQQLDAREATLRSMGQIRSALVGIASVLSAVFIPMAFLPGATGVIYRQFSITIVSAMVLSVLVAMSLTPALCASLLGHRSTTADNRFARAFNRGFEGLMVRYQRMIAHMLRRPVCYGVLYLGISAAMAILFMHLPQAFLPDEDQSYMFTFVRGPVGATQGRTLKAVDQVIDYFLNQEKQTVESIFTVAGSNFGGGGQNSAFGFIQLKSWDQRRNAGLSAADVQARAGGVLSKIKEAKVFAFAPPPVIELSTSAGFDFYLQDDFGQGHEALTAARDRLIELADQDKQLANVRPGGRDDEAQFHLDVDPGRVAAMGLSMAEVNDALSLAWGGRYIDDFVDRGRVKRVIVQGDAPYRMAPEDLGRWFVRNRSGQMVSMSSVVSSRWAYGSPRLERYNGLAAMEINGEAAPGVSSGQAIKEIDRLAAQLPLGFTVNYTGQSYQERAAGAQAPLIYSMSLLVVFLALAALYESWILPLAIIAAVPLGVIGAVAATAISGLESDIYFLVALLTTIGLTAKNAILVAEFARKNVEDGQAVVDAILRAARDRLRPIIMTSLAFGVGVLPLAVATGAGGGAQRAIGTGVFGGMLGATFLGVFFIPLLYLIVQRLFDRTTSNSNAH